MQVKGVGLPKKLRLALSPPSKDKNAVDGFLVGVDLKIELLSQVAAGVLVEVVLVVNFISNPIHMCTSSWSAQFASWSIVEFPV